MPPGMGITFMLHLRLEPFRDVNYIARINRAFKPVAREIEGFGFPIDAVEVQSNLDASPLHNLFTFRLNYDANQWLMASGMAFELPYLLTLPFRNGVSLPYSLQIVLKSRASVRATLDSWFTSRGRWFTDPISREASQRLRALRLPGVGWVHASGGLKHTLSCGGQILPPDDDCPTNRWIVFSAYQGFLFGVRPRVAKYLKAAVDLQTLLQAW